MTCGFNKCEIVQLRRPPILCCQIPSAALRGGVLTVFGFITPKAELQTDDHLSRRNQFRLGAAVRRQASVRGGNGHRYQAAASSRDQLQERPRRENDLV